MRIFSDLNKAYHEIQRDLYEVGVWIKGHTVQDMVVEGDPDFDFMELSPYLWCFTEPDDLKQLTDFAIGLDLNLAWLEAELSERLSSIDQVPELESELNPGQAWKHRAPMWSKFIERNTIFDGQFSYTYAQRFAHCRQLRRIKRELTQRPATRQAILSVYTYMLDARHMGVHHRTPCSMFYHFMLREGKLNLHYVMRSCDFHKHFPYDILLAILMQRFMAEQINQEVGVFSHFVTSLHGFRSDFPKEIF